MVDEISSRLPAPVNDPVGGAANLSVPPTSAPLDVIARRASAVLIGQACGDALGVPYEFVAPKLTGKPAMRGGGLGDYAPGEWSDDTQLSICLAEITAQGIDLTLEETLDDIATRYIAAVAGGVRELDAQTRVVFDSVLYDDVPGRPAQKMRRAAAYFHRRTLRSAGNGALARTAIVGLTRVHDPEMTAASARTVAELTHVDPLAGDSCVLLAEAIRRAVTDPLPGPDQWLGRLHLEAGLDLLPPQRRGQWAEWLCQAAEQYFKPPLDNSFTVTALQAAVGAIVQAATANLDPTRAFERAVEEAVRVGGDTDTIAAVTGALMGAAVGPEALPAPWVGLIHGWPGLDAEGLADLAIATALAGVVGEESMASFIASGVDLRAHLCPDLAATAPLVHDLDAFDVVDTPGGEAAGEPAPAEHSRHEGMAGDPDDAAKFAAPTPDAAGQPIVEEANEPPAPAPEVVLAVEPAAEPAAGRADRLAEPPTDDTDPADAVPPTPVVAEATAPDLPIYVPGAPGEAPGGDRFTPGPTAAPARRWRRLGSRRS